MVGQPWQRSAAKIVFIVFAAILLMLGIAACGNDGGSSTSDLLSDRATLKSDKRQAPANAIVEVSPPPALQTLGQLMEGYQPQVKVLNLKPNQILQSDTASVRFQVQDLPIFKDKDLGLGPHLHVFLDDEPYRPVYDLSQPLVFEGLSPGTHTLRVFASRPWHESFKNEGAYAQVTFHVLTKTPNNNPNPALPLLTYSRPQGSYGAEPVMLDFYLTNAPLHFVAQENETDNISDWRIRCTINGQSFVMDRWQPLYLKGLKPGQNWVKLEFLDDAGNPVGNVFNTTARLVNYQPGGQDTLSRLVTGTLSAAEARGIVEQGYTPPEPSPEPELSPELESTPTPEPELSPELELSPEPEPSPIPEAIPAIAPPTPTPSPSPTPALIEEDAIEAGSEPAVAEPEPEAIPVEEAVETEPAEAEAGISEPESAPADTVLTEGFEAGNEDAVSDEVAAEEELSEEDLTEEELAEEELTEEELSEEGLSEEEVDESVGAEPADWVESEPSETAIPNERIAIPEAVGAIEFPESEPDAIVPQVAPNQPEPAAEAVEESPAVTETVTEAQGEAVGEMVEETVEGAIAPEVTPEEIAPEEIAPDTSPTEPSTPEPEPPSEPEAAPAPVSAESPDNAKPKILAQILQFIQQFLDRFLGETATAPQ